MSDKPHHKWSLQTRLIHEGERAAPPTALPTSTPIYTTATYVYDSTSALDAAFGSSQDYVYARYGNPTASALEQAAAVAEGGHAAVALASGMAALYAAILAAGTPRGSTAPSIRSIVASRDLYGATTTLLEEFFASQGVSVTYCDMCELGSVEQTFSATQPDVVLVEQLSNPLLRVVDVQALAQRAHAVGARLVVDNTIATPILEHPLTKGADLVVHSATKYLGGHGDAVGGIVVARSALVGDTLRRHMKLLGSILGPFESQLILRGIKTLSLRVRQQCANATQIASWLAEQPQVEHVYYPGLPSHPQHELAKQAFAGIYGALVSFDLRQSERSAMFQFVDRLRLVLPATSLGDIYTLVSLPLISSHRDLTPAQRAERGIGDGLVRLSIGIEEADDLIVDLHDALTPTGEE